MKEPSNKDAIVKLLSDGVYIEPKVKALEDYVQTQLAESSYDFEANKTLLKLYLLFPNVVNQEKVVLMLLKALLNLPATDFTLLLYILPEKLHTDEVVLKIKDASEALETAQYAKFWSTINEGGAIFEKVPNWKNEIRKVILEVQAAAHATISKEFLAQSVGLDGVELDAFLSASDAIDKMDNGVVHFTANTENQPRVKKFKEKLELTNVLNVLNRLH